MLLSLYNSNKKKEIKQMPFAIDIPKEVSIPLPQISVDTRKGVMVTYDPTPAAVR